MQQISTWIATDLTDEDFAALAEALILKADVTALPQILLLAERHAGFWPSDRGQLVLAGILNLLVDTLDGGEVAEALAAMHPCPPALAQQALDLLVAALPEGALAAPAELDDAVVFCVALLAGASGQREAVATFLDQARPGRVASFFGPPADAIAAHFAPAPAKAEAFKPKLIIWDLDDTLWHGTLADGDEPALIAHRADYVRAFNRHGVVSAICSKNEFARAKEKLQVFGLWDEFVFPRIAFVPKGAVIRQMIADMQLRAQNVLFIDDNPHNLHEVADAVPGIRVVDATTPECDALLAELLAGQAHVEKSRVADYRLLETKVAERTGNALSDEEFLRKSGIHATFTDRMDNLEFAERIEELVNRSNQLNYTESRIEPGTIRDKIQDIDHYEVLCAFVWDKYGYYGLVGVAVYAFRTRTLEHFAFSCRIMHMGVEDAMIRMLAERGYRLEASPAFRKPLPPQSARAITVLPYAEPEVRARILAAEAPRDWSKVDLRIMADCQSGAFFHYSRHQAVTDFDNNPRLFSLPQMKTGAYREQSFPRYLVYTAATDFIDWRWEKFSKEIDYEIFLECVALFVEMVVKGGHKVLLFLPPQGLSLKMYELHAGCVPERSRVWHPVLNHHWRSVAAKYPGHFTLVELKDVLAADELVHAHHYVPSALRKISGMIDDWYDGEKAGEVLDVAA
ncbi:hypothetical protein [Sphingomonas sp. KR3-1]|uniref:hypothetical protein n=1 Tax=Sphingomonas sp. KR3-1 TaxID=3156611 RepID=UPI0032B4EA28